MVVSAAARGVDRMVPRTVHSRPPLPASSMLASDIPRLSPTGRLHRVAVLWHDARRTSSFPATRLRVVIGHTHHDRSHARIAAESLLTKDFGWIRAVDERQLRRSSRGAGGRLAGPQRLGAKMMLRMLLGLRRRRPAGRSTAVDRLPRWTVRPTMSGLSSRRVPFTAAAARNHLLGADHRGGHRADVGQQLQRPDRSSRSPRGHVLARHGPAAGAGRVARRPGVLILDEPANGLDPAGIRGRAPFCAALPAKVIASATPWPRSAQTVDEVLILDAPAGGTPLAQRRTSRPSRTPSSS